MSHQDKEIIYYEHLHCKVHWKYTSSFQYGFEIVRLEDILREENYCYGVDQYIKRFIDVLKERVIKYLPELKKVHVILHTMDKNNLLHRLVISVTERIVKMLNLKERKCDYYKSIFVIIKYEGKNVFMGHLNFDGLL
jgi:hypothetical protein